MKIVAALWNEVCGGRGLGFETRGSFRRTERRAGGPGRSRTRGALARRGATSSWDCERRGARAREETRRSGRSASERQVDRKEWREFNKEAERRSAGAAKRREQSGVMFSGRCDAKRDYRSLRVCMYVQYVITGRELLWCPRGKRTKPETCGFDSSESKRRREMETRVRLDSLTRLVGRSWCDCIGIAKSQWDEMRPRRRGRRALIRGEREWSNLGGEFWDGRQVGPLQGGNQRTDK